MSVYDNVVSAAREALAEYEETATLLEYPEVMADKAYYLSLLNKFNSLNFIKERLDNLTAKKDEEAELYSLLSSLRDDRERSAVFAEISRVKKEAASIFSEISKSLGKSVTESACCRIKLSGNSHALYEKFVALLRACLISRGIKISEMQNDKNDFVFRAEGDGAVSCLTPLSGCHKIITANGKNDYLLIAVTEAASEEEISENDIKIDVFHSHGAGGQNINKVETAVRATHLPSGISVVCQDERSQLKNKRRAIENLKRRVNENSGKLEKKRIEEDVKAQFSIKDILLYFDAVDMTVTDNRLTSFVKVSLDTTAEEFARYLDALALKGF